MTAFIMIVYLFFIVAVGICTFDSFRKNSKSEGITGVIIFIMLIFGWFLMFQ